MINKMIIDNMEAVKMFHCPKCGSVVYFTDKLVEININIDDARYLHCDSCGDFHYKFGSNSDIIEYEDGSVVKKSDKLDCYTLLVKKYIGIDITNEEDDNISEDQLIEKYKTVKIVYDKLREEKEKCFIKNLPNRLINLEKLFPSFVDKINKCYMIDEDIALEIDSVYTNKISCELTNKYDILFINAYGHNIIKNKIFIHVLKNLFRNVGMSEYEFDNAVIFTVDHNYTATTNSYGASINIFISHNELDYSTLKKINTKKSILETLLSNFGINKNKKETTK